jgi:O-antigen/teichoic acid export membrane protein
MLVKHSAVYLLGRVIPAIVSLATLTLYTRILDASEYGSYALIVAAAGVINAFFFQWISLSLGRFLSSEADGEALLSSALASFIVVILVTGIASGFILWAVSDTTTRSLIVITVTISWAQAWFDLNVKVLNIRLRAGHHSIITSSKALVTFVCGILLFYCGLRFHGVLIGLFVGLLLPTFFLREHWKGTSYSIINPKEFVSILRYGAPLTLSFGSVIILSVADRFLLHTYTSSEAVGRYSAAFDLTQQSLGVLMVVINLAAFPLIVRELNENGIAAAQKQLRDNANVLLTVSFPAAVGLIVLAGNISFVILGEGFQQGAETIISFVALTALLNGIRSYYFDYSFHLSKKLRGQVIAILSAATFNILLNLFLIPVFGALGAAVASLIAASLGLFMSWYLGRKVFPLPGFSNNIYKIGAASVAMGVSLSFIAAERGAAYLIYQLLAGIVCYVFFALVFDIAEVRQRAKRCFAAVF